MSQSNRQQVAQSNRQESTHKEPECKRHGSEFSVLVSIDPMGKSWRCRWKGEEIRDGRKGTLRCSWRARVAIGRQDRGFLNGKTSNGIFETKIKVLTAVKALEGQAVISSIVSESGLSRGQVEGCLARCYRYDFAERSEEMVALVPQGHAFLWSLSERGEQFLTWSDSWYDKGEKRA